MATCHTCWKTQPMDCLLIIIKRISDLVYFIQDICSRRRQVVNFERLESCSQQMRDRNQPSSVDTQEDTQALNTTEEGTRNRLLGTILELVDG